MKIAVTMILLITSLCVFSVSAADVLLTGVVMDSHEEGITGAVIKLKNYPHIKTVSQDGGQFSLNGDTDVPVVYYSKFKSGDITFSVNGSLLTLDLPYSVADADIAYFDLRGRQMFYRHIGKLKQGKYSEQINYKASGAGIVKIVINGASYQFKTCLAGDKMFFSRISGISQKTFGATKSIMDAVSDTIIAYMPGYRNKLTKTDTYTADGIEITVTESKQWVPDTAPEHEKNMVKIMAAGHDFEMGSWNPDIWCDSCSIKEFPVHTVVFTEDFWMDTTEVTQKDFDSLMAITYPDYLVPEWDDKHGLADRIPAYFLNWDDAVLYCNARSIKEALDTVYSYDSVSGNPGNLCIIHGMEYNLDKDGYRLPTEAEWEYACRGGTTTDYYWGKDADGYPLSLQDTSDVGKYAVWLANSWDMPRGDGYGTHEVASLLPNNYGLYDMGGNLYEWVNDWFDSFAFGEVTDPFGPSEGIYHFARGGSWGTEAEYLRSSNRYLIDPDYEYYFRGFRTVRKAD
jgi:formylglycine-generating enzyme required for sulfatase activity